MSDGPAKSESDGPGARWEDGPGPTPQTSTGVGGTYDSDHLSGLFWQAKHPTIVYCFLFWAFGMCVAFLGPTLCDLGLKTNSTTATMSWIFVAQSLFILVGSAVGGFLITKLPETLVLLVSTTMLAVTLSLIPFCNAIFWLAVVMAFMGFYMGTIDTIANVSMIKIYGKFVGPFLQTLHFFYGLGAFVSPMIAEPFLVDRDCDSLRSKNSSDDQKDDDGSAILEVDTTASVEDMAQELSRVDYAFWCMALLQVPVILMVVSLPLKNVLAKFRQKEVTAKSDDGSAAKLKKDYESVELDVSSRIDYPTFPIQDDHPPVTNTQLYSVIFLTSLMLFLYDGLQASYGGYISSYASKIDKMPRSEAAYVTACYWGLFAFGRLVSIIISARMTPAMMLLCNIVGCIFSMALLFLWNHSRVALYIGTCTFGAFLSSVYPTTVSLAEQYVQLTSGITSVIVVGAASGEMLFPLMVGQQFDSHPINFLITGFVVTLFSLFVYVALRGVGSTILRKQGHTGLFGSLMALVSMQPSEQGGEETGLVSRHVKYYSRMRETSESNDGDQDDRYEEAIEISHEDYGRK